MITEWLQGTSGDHIVQAKSGEETLLEAYGEKIDPGSLSGLWQGWPSSVVHSCYKINLFFLVYITAPINLKR